MKRSKLEKIKQAITFLELKGLSHLDFGVSSMYNGVSLAIDSSEVPEGSEDLRQLKRVFGPWEFSDGYNSKSARGSYALEEDLKISVSISQYFVCEELDPTELTEEKWDEIKEHARNGRIKLQDCKREAA